MDVNRICVIGAGTMGHGIAHVAAAAGFETRLFDIKQEFVDSGLAKIRANLDKGVEKGKVSPEDREAALANLRGSADLAEAAANADLIIEAVPEKPELKHDVYSKLQAVVPQHCVFASNTSSLSIAKLAAATDRADRFIGMHFFNPVHIMALLEIVIADSTSESTLQLAKAVGERMGKTNIVVKDFPGFATSRLGVVLGLEAMRMVEQGVASPADIDTAMELGYRHPMGPLRLTDLVGLDVRLGIAEYLHKELESAAFAPPQILKDMVAGGKLGKKSGQGFYTWND
ncbi:MAG: 3-hydroxyacyl-CoA dehydrogenase family protein [Planctomycetes bacterium]|nr:3-hydroxyacyl-CoA dehydrogenase family protein [Planctomycetota bacterium]